MDSHTKQDEALKDAEKAIDALAATLKDSGMDDELITYTLNKVSNRAAMYAEDIEKGAMHLNKGFDNWVRSN